MAKTLQTWSDTEAQAVLKQLRKSKPPRRQEMSTKQVLYQYYLPTILNWLAEGWAYKDVVAVLAEHGVHVKRSSLYRYVQDYRKQQKVLRNDATARCAESTPDPAAANTSHGHSPPDPSVDRAQPNEARVSGKRKATLVDRLNRPL